MTELCSHNDTLPYQHELRLSCSGGVALWQLYLTGHATPAQYAAGKDAAQCMMQLVLVLMLDADLLQRENQT